MTRRPFHLLSSLSLLLCLAGVAMWIVGYCAPGRVAKLGLVEVRAWPQSWFIQSTRAPEWGRAREAIPPLNWRLPREVFPQWIWDGTDFRLQIPYWIPVALFGLLPATHACRQWRHARRKRGGQCPSCGYDLRTSPDRCPECGAVPAPKPREAHA